jgi:hypothetical protein
MIVRAPRKRLAHISEDKRTPEYEREINRVYRLAPVYATRVSLGERTDALLSVSARHALRLTAGNLLLLVSAAVFFANGDAQFETMWQPVIAFVVLMLVLTFRPSGLLGEHIPEKV